MKPFLSLIVTLCLAASFGCTMCSHPFDYSYAAYDEAQLSGNRAGSILAPSSSQSVMTEPSASDVEATEQEVLFFQDAN